MEENKKNVSAKKAPQKKVQYSLSNLKKIMDSEEVVDMLVQDIDDSFNMVGIVGNKIKAILPREESSSIVAENGLVDEKHIINKKGKILHVCIKEIIENSDGSFELVMSKKKLELKVRRWMYMHLQAGMSLKGVVVSTNDHSAFVDVGGGVTGILKAEDITDTNIKHTSDVLKIGQRIKVTVKKFDRDTGRIELSYKEQLGTFEDNIKKFKEGDIVEGIIRGRIKTGIFVELKPNLVGLAEHVNGVEYGQKVLVSIRRIIPEKKKIKLVIIG
jgi:polyribonucleotide nucleotidyltransferase